MQQRRGDSANERTPGAAIGISAEGRTARVVTPVYRMLSYRSLLLNRAACPGSVARWLKGVCSLLGWVRWAELVVVLVDMTCGTDGTASFQPRSVVAL